MDRRYPRRYVYLFALFLLVLVGYLVLIFNDPAAGTREGVLAQVIGQKVVVYACVLSVLAQSVGARRVLRQSAQDRPVGPA
jgi:hypothetical protein